MKQNAKINEKELEKVSGGHEFPAGVDPWEIKITPEEKEFAIQDHKNWIRTLLEAGNSPSQVFNLVHDDPYVSDYSTRHYIAEISGELGNPIDNVYGF